MVSVALDGPQYNSIQQLDGFLINRNWFGVSMVKHPQNMYVAWVKRRIKTCDWPEPAGFHWLADPDVVLTVLDGIRSGL